MISHDVRAASARLAHYRQNPVDFVKSEFGVTPDDWQGDALMAYPTTPRLAMQACVGPGKTAVLAWIPLNFVVTRPLPKVACTSITWANLRDNLWAEFSKWINKSEFLSSVLTWTQTKIFLDDPDNPGLSWISARTWDRAADPEQQAQTLKGLHADYVMAIADETGAMPPIVLRAAEGVLSSCIEGHIVQGGNPIDRTSALYQATEGSKSSGSWHSVRVTGDPLDPKRAPRVGVEWAQQAIDDNGGRESAWVRANVLGLWPLQSTDAIIGLHHYEEARNRKADPSGTLLQKGLRTLGVDVARFGADRTVVALRDGDFLVRFYSWQGKSTDVSAEKVLKIARDEEVTHIYVDDIGVGGGVTDILKRTINDLADEGEVLDIVVRGINVGEASDVLGSDGQPLYANLKAEANMQIAEKRFKTGRVGILDEAHETPLQQQCTDIRFGFGAGGKTFKIESKDAYKKRHSGESPDFWDATVLAFMVRPFAMESYGWM